MRRRSGPRAGRKYPRRTTWMNRRDLAFARAGAVCEVSGEYLFVTVHGEDCDGSGKNCDCFDDDNYCRNVYRRACDHIFPERFVRRFCKGGDPHVLENLIVITPSLHAKKTAVEWRIFRGDLVGYQQELRRLGFDQTLLDKAMKAIVASVKE